MVADLEKTIKACKKGERRAQEKFYRHFYGFAMSACMPYANSHAEAEEIVHDGFIKVFTSFKKFRTGERIEPWLKRIIVNTAIDHYRSQQKHYNQIELNEAMNEQHVDLSALQKMAEDDIMGLVQRLTPAYRMVFTLYTVEGYKHREIAARLGISEATSKTNLMKAKEKLKHLIITYQVTGKHG